MKLLSLRDAVVEDLKTNAAFLEDVAGHGRVLDLETLKRFSIQAPACRIGVLGVARMGRNNLGQFRGPVQMIAFLIEGDDGLVEARDKAIDLAEAFATFIEHRTFGLTAAEAGPAMVQRVEFLYAAEIDEIGAAVATVAWDQELVFGRDLHGEDEALLDPLHAVTELPEQVLALGEGDEPITVATKTP